MKPEQTYVALCIECGCVADKRYDGYWCKLCHGDQIVFKKTEDQYEN